MANPDIVSVQHIYGTTWVQSVLVSPTVPLVPVVATGTVIKLDALYVGNIDTSASYKITVDLYRGGVAYNILYQISIPAGAGLDVLSKSIYLMEGDSLRTSADFAGKLQAVASGEVIS